MLFELVHKTVEMENESFFYGKIDDFFQYKKELY